MTSRVRASILAITVAAFVAVPSIAAAQSNAVVGVKAGLNVAKLKFEDDQGLTLKTKVGAVAGLFVSKAINDNVGIRGEALFSQKGAKVEAGGQSGKFKLTYFDVPVLLTFGPSSSGDTHFNFFTGPQLSFKTKAESEFGGETNDESDSVKGTDFGWVVGVGLANGRFSADARYALGLSNVNKDTDGTVKNRTFSVMVGVNLTK